MTSCIESQQTGNVVELKGGSGKCESWGSGTVKVRLEA